MGVLISVGSSFLAKVGVYVLNSYYQDEVSLPFSFESNLLLFQWLTWKIMQIMLGYYNNYNFDFGSLLATMAVLAFINTVKTFRLFDY